MNSISNRVEDDATFLGATPKIKRAVGPELIKWNNLGATRLEQNLWTTFIYFLSWLILFGTITAIVRIRNLTSSVRIDCAGVTNLNEIIKDL